MGGGGNRERCLFKIFGLEGRGYCREGLNRAFMVMVVGMIYIGQGSTEHDQKIREYEREH